MDDVVDTVERPGLATPPPTRRDLYHGTTKAGAEAIVKNGVDPNFRKRNMDFGKGGFYTTENRTQAEEWAQNIAGRTPGAEPVVLHCRVSQQDLDKLNNKKFDGPSQELDDFLRNSRTGGPMHNYDSVEGPMLRNLKGFLQQGKPARLTGHQIAIYAPEAAAIFNRGLQGVL
ncbi:MAG: DUF3990 domain-containing protein [Streptomyces sp.]|nr:DUF3990 domain-containing protein [Streptomyces sp.]